MDYALPPKVIELYYERNIYGGLKNFSFKSHNRTPYSSIGKVTPRLIQVRFTLIITYAWVASLHGIMICCIRTADYQVLNEKIQK